MRVAKPDARDFYEREAIECGWDKRSLERQIHSQYYEKYPQMFYFYDGIRRPG